MACRRVSTPSPPARLSRAALLLALGFILVGQGDWQWPSGFAAAQAVDPTGPYQMITDKRTRQNGQSYTGDRSRLLMALQRYKDGSNLTIGVVGGSISAGQGAVDAPPYPHWARIILHSLLPPGAKDRVNVVNGAMPGATSQYMSSCVSLHVPSNVDIVFVEYAVNDDEMPMPHMNNPVRPTR
ncbi:hypothetical protein HYH03_013208 [Edaphochlamys debaryana]|uniref:SGNH hydrolase-type esterase domain-containing protein n=1 Tax=Edaphochlamys debaryana TaxID=47281 RepID=A0A836BUR1_9CHLO|nr:hypothetical protein HYH03_013208 [Edaphochlamys debaryana]|eukprot:KAG2488214.1 hypothetical protein HYH03_013208 [Edaphochlamys debaryana]